MRLYASRYRLYYFLVTYVSVFAVLACLGYYTAARTGMVRRHDSVPQKFATDLTYYDLPRMTVALNDGKNGPRVRLDISLEVAKKDLQTVEGFQPHIVDKLNNFFVTLDSQQIQQSTNMAWLHREMLKRVNTVGSPAPVHDVFLRQMLVM